MTNETDNRDWNALKVCLDMVTEKDTEITNLTTRAKELEDDIQLVHDWYHASLLKNKDLRAKNLILKAELKECKGRLECMGCGHNLIGYCFECVEKLKAENESLKDCEKFWYDVALNCSINRGMIHRSVIETAIEKSKGTTIRIGDDICIVENSDGDVNVILEDEELIRVEKLKKDINLVR